ncbi:barstar family protein [Chryseobacterium sp.]|uniref:barstar family protein n=1 Tax=Chryseobacterium sp. TaxID=1871047 RepID=UPI00260F046A|nr:barstar family protein [Chryseobacterium sp.]
MIIQLNDKYFGINYINLKRNENIIEDKLLLRIDNVFRQDILDQIENNGRLKIYTENRNNHSFCLYETKFITDYIYLLEEHNNEEEIILNVVMLNNKSALSDSYNQHIVDIFYKWEQGIETDWFSINNLEIKRSYLDACYLWSCQSFELKNINEINIKGEFIRYKEDLYYYLGEYLIGTRGYFGSNLDSFEDFLIDIVKNNKINIKIVFTNSDTIIKNTNKFFFQEVVSLLEKAKFKVEIISSE